MLTCPRKDKREQQQRRNVQKENQQLVTKLLWLVERMGGLRSIPPRLNCMTPGMLHILLCSCQIRQDKTGPVIQTEYPLSEMLETRCVVNFFSFWMLRYVDAQHGMTWGRNPGLNTGIYVSPAPHTHSSDAISCSFQCLRVKGHRL